MSEKKRRKILLGQDKNVVIITEVSGHQLVSKKEFEVSDMKFLSLKVSVISPPVQVKLNTCMLRSIER